MKHPCDSGWILAVIEDLIAFSAQNRMRETESALSRALQAARLESRGIDMPFPVSRSPQDSNVVELELWTRPKQR